jgi:hypothetical protein
MTNDLRLIGRMIGIMIIIYAPFWLMFRAHGDELVPAYPHLEQSNPYAATSPKQWHGDITIGIESGAEQLRPYLEYAAWQWSQRTGKKITVSSGASPSGHSTSGKITATIKDVPSMAQTQLWYFMDTGNIAGVVIRFDPIWLFNTPDCVQHMVTHELGHALGGSGHTESKSDVMYPTQTHCRYALSAADIGHVPYDGNSCFVELLKDFSLFIPSVNGYSALLKYTEAGWKLSEYLPSSGKCSTVFELNLNLTFGDIRSASGNYRAQLRYTENETWTLDYVE